MFDYRVPDVNDSVRAKAWFAVFTVPRHEKRVEEHCALRGIESFLPLYKKKRQWKNGSKGLLELPLFPNYIFVRIGCAGRIPLLEIPGVRSIVGGMGQPWQISDSYIQFLREGLRLNKIEPHPYLTEGARVRIRSGVMAGLEGILLRNKDNYRVVLTLEMMMKSIKIEVAIDDLEPVTHVPCAPLSQLPRGA